jgi:hypothetical protein
MRQSPALFPNLTAAPGARELPPLPTQRAVNPAFTRVVTSSLPRPVLFASASAHLRALAASPQHATPGRLPLLATTDAPGRRLADKGCSTAPPATCRACASVAPRRSIACTWAACTAATWHSSFTPWPSLRSISLGHQCPDKTRSAASEPHSRCAASSLRFGVQSVCVCPMPPLPYAPPPRGLLRSASLHLTLLDKCKRQVAQLRVSFMLALPAASLACPCSTAAPPRVRPAHSTLRAHMQAPAVAHFALVRVAIRTPR